MVLFADPAAALQTAEQDIWAPAKAGDAGARGRVCGGPATTHCREQGGDACGAAPGADSAAEGTLQDAAHGLPADAQLRGAAVLGDGRGPGNHEEAPGSSGCDCPAVLRVHPWPAVCRGEALMLPSARMLLLFVHLTQGLCISQGLCLISQPMLSRVHFCVPHSAS